MAFGYAVYFAERTKNRVIRWDPDSGDAEVVAGEPKDGDQEQTLNQPYGLAIERSGSLLIADKKNHRVCRLKNGRLHTITFHDPTGHRSPRPGGRQLCSPHRPLCPTSLLAEEDGSLLCTFSDENTIYRVHPGGGLELLLGISPNRLYRFGQLRPVVMPNDIGHTPLMMPTVIVKRKDNTLFFIERQRQVVRSYEPSVGLISIFPFEKYEDYQFKASIPDQLPVSEYHPSHPGSLALDAQDALYLSEPQHGCLLKVDFKAGDVSKVIQVTRPVGVPSAGPAAVGFGPDGTAWLLNSCAQAVEAYEPAPSGFWKPMGIRLTDVRGTPLKLPVTGSGLALGN